MAEAAREPVGVALCTFRGARHLGEQLDSLEAQTWPVRVYVHDDASDDATVAMARAHPAVTEVVAHRDNVGHVRNFERALADVARRGHAWIACCDQDDRWHPDRVARCMAAARTVPEAAGRPLLVHSDLAVVDAAGGPRHPSYLRWRGYAVGPGPALPVTLGQCGVMGNTVLVNAALLELALPFPPRLHVHDWWLAAIADVHGARVFVDAPLVDYRVHVSNASNSAGSAAERGALASLARLPRALARRDLRLPYREDGRREAVLSLLHGDGRRVPATGADAEVLRRFDAWLAGDGAALPRVLDAWRAGFLRPGLGHRVRVLGAALLTRRYAPDQAARRTG